MAYLADTNVLLRWAQPHHPLSALIHRALATLRQDEDVRVAPQNLVEFWNAATRPLNRNGFGFSPVQADEELARLESLFVILPETPAIYPAWRRLVTNYGVSGVQVHDARLVAVMQVHGITRILTLNGADFRRYREIIPVHPQDVPLPPDDRP